MSFQNYQGQLKVHYGAVYIRKINNEVAKCGTQNIFQKDFKNEAHTQFSSGFNACSTLSSHDQL